MNEIWLTGTVAGVHPLVTPAAHSFLQVEQDIGPLLDGLTVAALWATPGASTSIGFHALHLAGATERLLTYARGAALSDAQLAAAKAEKSTTNLEAAEVAQRVRSAMADAVAYLRTVAPDSLTAAREVGRQRLPATVGGLIFHAAEHATRHLGQMSTLRRVVAP